MASEWHKNTQKTLMKEWHDKGYETKAEEKIGFEHKITRKTQFKQVDIVAKKDAEIILIEIEDRIYHTKKYGECGSGIGYVELGGNLFLSHFFSELNPNKKAPSGKNKPLYYPKQF